MGGAATSICRERLLPDLPQRTRHLLYATFAVEVSVSVWRTAGECREHGYQIVIVCA